MRPQPAKVIEMSVSVCPIAIVNAPPERIWALLSEPASYAVWWDADTRTITPSGPAQPGQTILAQTRGLGLKWPVRISVNAVDAARRAIDLTARLPLGITVYNHITVAPAEGGAGRVSFG
jgi:ligand-binding SRPBCC domain-containing protein